MKTNLAKHLNRINMMLFVLQKPGPKIYHKTIIFGFLVNKINNSKPICSFTDKLIRLQSLMMPNKT